MATLHELGEPVNDAERQVLRRLRDELDDSWHVVSNFWIQQGKRQFECDALAVTPEGWAYLIETKGWQGRIRGNDAQWELPPIVPGAAPTYPANPVELTHRKSQILKDVLREADAPLKALYIAPLVVLVSDIHPDLQGRWASATVLLDDMIGAVLKDPRDFKRKPPAALAERVATVLEATVAPMAPPSVVGQWQLLEQIEVGALSEVWSARPRFGGENAQLVRLKKYALDPLLTGDEAHAQWERVRRDLEALEQLSTAGAAVPLQAYPERIGDEFILVTPWPRGQSIASLLATGALDGEFALELFSSLVHATASVHRAEVVHRNLTPRCAHVMDDGRVVLTDFDYARLGGRTGGITRHIESELDETYVAPEVAADPGAATAESDVWSLGRIALDIFDAAGAGGQPDLTKLPSTVRPIVEQCLKPLVGERFASAEIIEGVLRSDEPAVNPLFDGFLPNDEIDERFVVRDEASGGGGLSRVYRVYDVESEAEYAAKFVRPEFQGQIDPADEFRLMKDIPEHPGIVKPSFPARMSTFRRSGRQHQLQERFLLAPWVEGTRLDRIVREGVSVARALELALGITEAVGHLHDNDLLHRDLKPQNVLVDEVKGIPRLVDFNVSGRAGEVGRTETGTMPYRPDDFALGWDTTCDLYAVGVVACELLAGRTLGPDASQYVEGATHLPESLRALLGRAVSASRTVRFSAASEFANELRHAFVEVSAPKVTTVDAPFPDVDPAELARPNWNPFQYRLSQLFSQSSTSNAGTRGLDEFARWAYVETKIDRELVADVVGGRYGLVIVTGNAGDGKTAFIQMIERRIREEGGDVSTRPNGNGADIAFHGHRLATNWDGSQDEGDVDNDAVLLEFFGPFRGMAPPRVPGETRLIAINEGRLLDFLETHADQFPWLDETIRRLFVEEISTTADWLCLVNLNLRALTLPAEPDEVSIVDALLERFADARLWEPCTGCVAYEHCYARSNAAALRDPVLGPLNADRIRAVLDVARLRRRLHITMRDLRSALAYVVAGSRTCEEIVDLVDRAEPQPLIAGHMYNALFAASDSLEPPAWADDASRDRLLNIVGTLDVARTADPEEDARLWVLGLDALRPEPAGLHRSDRMLLAQLRDRLPQSALQLMDDRVQADLRLLHGSLRRKLLLEREDPGWTSMLPYTRLRQFSSILEACTEEDLYELAGAISNSDGLFNQIFANKLATRLVTDSDGPNRSYVLHAIDDFTLEVVDRSSAARYVEYAPDAVRLAHRNARDCFLDIDVDLHETLRRIRDGFTPSREEMRGAWLNLKIFKERLATLNSEALLISGADRRFRQVRRDGQRIVASEVTA